MSHSAEEFRVEVVSETEVRVIWKVGDDPHRRAQLVAAALSVESEGERPFPCGSCGGPTKERSQWVCLACNLIVREGGGAREWEDADMATAEIVMEEIDAHDTGDRTDHQRAANLLHLLHSHGLVQLLTEEGYRAPAALAQPTSEGAFVGGCNMCGGRLVAIRGKVPGMPKREVCPTCLMERTENAIATLNSNTYRAYSATPAPIEEKK